MDKQIVARVWEALVTPELAQDKNATPSPALALGHQVEST